MRLPQVVDQLHQAALQIGSFVIVPSILFCELIDHAQYLRQELLRFGLVSHFTQLSDSCTCRLLVVTVLQTLNCVLADAFLC